MPAPAIKSMSSRRPYCRYSTAELERKLNAHSDDLVLRRHLRDELNHRNTSAARALKLRVAVELEKLENPKGAVERTSAAARPRPQAPRVSVRQPPKAQAVIPPARPILVNTIPNQHQSTSIESAYQELRKVISAESEPLYRWGVNALLPQNKVLEVLTWWESKVTLVPDSLGRCRKTLAEDRKRYLAESALVASK